MVTSFLMRVQSSGFRVQGLEVQMLRVKGYRVKIHLNGTASAE
jgi:hypothetical protein